MNPRQRFHSVLNFKHPGDRLPLIEWAAWWDKTMDRWKNEGFPVEVTWSDSQDYFGLDPMFVLYVRTALPGIPRPSHHGDLIITDEESYDAIRKYLFTDSLLEDARKQALAFKERHERGEIVIRVWLDGFFWFPRKLFGIEPHMYAFYDYPELMHRMNSELAEFNIKVLRAVFDIIKPDMVGFAEDMSYNHGPMLSRKLYNEFLLPYYKKVIPCIKEHDIRVFVDSDGDISTMISWFEDGGIDGAYPLERQAGVDIADIRKNHPKFLMMGGYDKMALMRGEPAIRAEFERLLPVMKRGGFIPSMDHQTPPECSLENYRVYIELFKEYAVKASA